MNEQGLYIFSKNISMSDERFRRVDVCIRKDKILVENIKGVDGIVNAYYDNDYRIDFQIAKCFNKEGVLRQVEIEVKSRITSIMGVEKLTNGSEDAPDRLKKLLTIDGQNEIRKNKCGGDAPEKLKELFNKE